MTVSAPNPTKALLVLAVDAATLRHQAIAANLANVHSAGYSPVRVNFEQQLDAARAAVRSGGKVTHAELAGVKAFVEADPDAPAGGLASALDLEMVKMSRNVVHYQALLRMMSKLGAPMDIAVNEGRK